MNNILPTRLSIVIPLFNEEVRFKEAFVEITKMYQKCPEWEFIFVNDGSKDKTRSVVREAITNKGRMKLISYSPNQGKGFAIKQGIKKTSKPLALLTDIDLSTPFTDVSLLYPFINRGADIVIGTRKVSGARILVRQPAIREWLGKRFTDISNVWLGLSITDFTCGFKLLRAPVAKKLFSLQRVHRWGFDAEVLFLASLYHKQIVEVPITWTNDRRTRVSLLLDLLRSLYELWSIRWNYWTGQYKVR